MSFIPFDERDVCACSRCSALSLHHVLWTPTHTHMHMHMLMLLITHTESGGENTAADMGCKKEKEPALHAGDDDDGRERKQKKLLPLFFLTRGVD